MNPAVKTILRDLGLFLHIPGVMALISLPVCLAWGETYAVRPFVICAIASLATGQILYRCCCSANASRTPYAMITAALGWLILPLFAAIPLVAIANELSIAPGTSATILRFSNPWNAIFEGMAGFTSAGLSMALHYDELPRSIQWWRSLMQWVGGVGVIVLVISVLEPSTNPYQLYNAEARQKRIGLTVGTTVRYIWWIYLLYTVFAIFLLRIAGMSWWSALNHSFTAISTGGFSIRDDSIGAYGAAVKIATMVVMILGAISFPIHYKLIYKRRWKALVEDNQHQALWILLVLGIVGLWFLNYLANAPTSLLDTIFQWVSALTTTGFNTVQIKPWNEGAKLLMAIAMIIGGAAGSTTGGIKLNRFVFLFKAVIWRFRLIALLPHEMMRYRLDGEIVKEAEANRRIEAAAVIAFLWMVFLAIGVLILSQLQLPQYTLSDTIFETASALGSVGLSTGITHPDLPWLGKLVLIVLMWMGRLEIIPVLLLLSLPIKTISQRVKSN
ncbi:TrkH family potassium uptake protein [Myxosarcina sp. GI1]|uniref:TrkH family potassium uptake protein n=1 Tax=Myxosarcina sp. GI1 TaxID=1541065 RepID=UPI00056C4C56|nr:TrkH family potassium uptake protein [Myxosarcina sp. GI1]